MESTGAKERNYVVISDYFLVEKKGKRNTGGNERQEDRDGKEGKGIQERNARMRGN